MNKKKLKLKHYIATHTFHSAKVRKEFREVNSHRKKNSDWFGNESIELKQSFFKLLRDRALVEGDFNGNFYDKDGELASEGKLIPELERKLNKLNFFKLKPPKSLGIEWVKENILPIFEIYQKCSINDILHTYTIFIAKKISYELSGRKEALVTGGGAFNSFLIEQIKNRTSCLIRIPEKKVINFKEAIIFAFLGLLRNQNKVNCYSSVTGAKKNHSTGNIFLP